MDQNSIEAEVVTQLQTTEGHRVSRALAHIREELFGPEARPSGKETLITFGVLGLVAVTSSIDEILLHSPLKHSAWPERFWEESGRHFMVGLAGAAIASTDQRFDNMAGAIAGATVADIAVEAAESVTITGALHDGWQNVGDFASQKELIWQNAQDWLGAATAAVGYRSRLWWLERKTKAADKI